jgi:hypothetical protein
MCFLSTLILDSFSVLNLVACFKYAAEFEYSCCNTVFILTLAIGHMVLLLNTDSSFSINALLFLVELTFVLLRNHENNAIVFIPPITHLRYSVNYFFLLNDF